MIHSQYLFEILIYKLHQSHSLFLREKNLSTRKSCELSNLEKLSFDRIVWLAITTIYTQ